MAAGDKEAAEESKGGRVKESIQQIQRDKIFPFMLDLLFENLVKVIDSITYEDVVFEFWDLELTLGVPPDPNIFNQKEGQFLIKSLAAYIKLYFRGISTEAAP